MLPLHGFSGKGKERTWLGKLTARRTSIKEQARWLNLAMGAVGGCPSEHRMASPSGCLPIPLTHTVLPALPALSRSPSPFCISSRNPSDVRVQMALGRRERGGTGEAGLRRHGGQTEGWKGKAGGSRLAAFQQVLLPSLPSSCTPVSRASSPRVSLFSFHRLLPRRLSSHPPVRSWKHQPCAFFLMSDILPHRYNKAFWTPSVQNQTSILFRNALNPVTVLLHDRGFKFENNKGSIYSVVDGKSHRN